MSRYELLERIGAGGMAEIFRGKAIAAGGFEKPVAIKRILPHLSKDERFVELLISEAKILSRLRHRNIVQIYDVGLAEDGQYFLVMEFVDGNDLGQLYSLLERQRTRIPVDVALHIGAEVCEALDHAHRAFDESGQPIRLVHRDVSPSNVLLSRSGEVKLTDFGIAKSFEEATGHGGVRGKFAYISPEQARNLHVDGRSDSYALAIILFELVTGRPLYSGMAGFDALTAARDPQIVRIREIDPMLPIELERILERALAPNPEQRYATAADFGSALRTFRYSMDETSGDPAKAIGELVEEMRREDEDEDDSRTVMRSIPFGDADTVLANPDLLEDEETRAISILGGEASAITFSALPVAFAAGAREPELAASSAGGKRAPRRAGAPESRSLIVPASGPGSMAETRAESPVARGSRPASSRPQSARPPVSPRPQSARPPVSPRPQPAGYPEAFIATEKAHNFRQADPVSRAISWQMMIGLAVLAAVIAMAAFFVAGKILAAPSPSSNSQPSAPTDTP